ncbi:MFS transporter [Roseococcus sp. YIM B11640]|uniref:MFS transporter n=1 Tax=Roseococcus sp. YIM B11640 TaxID=3133973 RepID=UPI003C7BC3B6
MSRALPAASPPFFGWRVTWAAFTVAIFAWGVSFYGPPVFLHAVHEARGWPIWLVSAAVTSHYLWGAFVVANLPALHARFGVGGVTALGGVLSGLGMLAWALAVAPWQLFAATLVSGSGWAMTGAAAINAMVSPWFIRRRPAALSLAYNGASVGGIVFSPLWVALIAAWGFAGAAAGVGLAMAVTLGLLAARTLSVTPEQLGQAPDGDAAGPAASRTGVHHAPLPGRDLWRNLRFATLVVSSSLSLFAQIGLIAHLFSLLVVPMGTHLAGFAAGLATVCAILGRSLLGFLLTPGRDRRVAAILNSLVQVVGSLVLLASGGTDIALLLSGIVLFGLGLGNAASIPAMIAQSDFAPADTGRVVALVTACSQATYAFAPAAFGLLRDFATGPHGLFAAAAAIQLAAALAILAGRQPSR